MYIPLIRIYWRVLHAGQMCHYIVIGFALIGLRFVCGFGCKSVKCLIDIIFSFDIFTGSKNVSTVEVI